MQEAVHLRRQLGQRRLALRRDDPQRRLHHRHDERRGHALAGDVRERDPDALVAEIEEIVVVAADASGRQADGGQHGHVALRRLLGKQPPLDLSRQGDIAAQLLLLDDPRGQPRVLDHQRQLLRALAQQASRRRCTAAPLDGGPSSSMPRISSLARRATAIRAPLSSSV